MAWPGLSAVAAGRGVAYQVYWTHFMPRCRTPSMPCGKSAAFQHTHPARRDDYHYFSRFKHLRRGWWAMRSPVICSLSAVAIRARDSAPRFAQANHLLLGRWGRRAGEQLPKGGHIRRNRRFPAFSLVKRQFSAPGGIRTPALLLRRQLLCPAELRALERNCVRRRSRDGYVKVAECRPLRLHHLGKR